MFNLAVATQPAARRNLTVAGCRILARQFRARVEARQAVAVALVGRSLACPLDLHALLPVPDARSAARPDRSGGAGLAGGPLGHHRSAAPGHRAATARPAVGCRQATRSSATGSSPAGETPQTAIATLAARWPALNFVLRPRPAD